MTSSVRLGSSQPGQVSILDTQVATALAMPVLAAVLTFNLLVSLPACRSVMTTAFAVLA